MGNKRYRNRGRIPNHAPGNTGRDWELWSRHTMTVVGDFAHHVEAIQEHVKADTLAVVRAYITENFGAEVADRALPPDMLTRCELKQRHDTKDNTWTLYVFHMVHVPPQFTQRNVNDISGRYKRACLLSFQHFISNVFGPGVVEVTPEYFAEDQVQALKRDLRL